MEHTEWISTSEDEKYTRSIEPFELSVWRSAQEDVWQAYVHSESHGVGHVFTSRGEAQSWCERKVANVMAQEQPLKEREAGT